MKVKVAKKGRDVFRDHTAVVGTPAYLNVPNSTIRQPSTLDGIHSVDYTMTDRTPYPAPINLSTKYNSQDAFASYIQNEKLKQKSFNYFKPDFQRKSYTQNLFSEYGATLTAEQTAKAQSQVKGIFAGMQTVSRPL